MDKDKILERLRKVLAMTKSTNANEAENARRIAAKMMAEHGICEAEVEVKQRGKDGVKVVDERGYAGTAQRKWEFYLAMGIAAAIGCETYIIQEGEGKKRYVRYYGLESEVRLAQELHAILRKQARSTARKVATSKTSYLNGFGIGVYDNGEAIAKYRTQQSDAANSNALMVVNRAVQAHADKLKLRPTRTRKSRVRTSDYERGLHDGRSADLSGEKLK